MFTVGRPTIALSVLLAAVALQQQLLLLSQTSSSAPPLSPSAVPVLVAVVSCVKHTRQRAALRAMWANQLRADPALHAAAHLRFFVGEASAGWQRKVLAREGGGGGGGGGGAAVDVVELPGVGDGYDALPAKVLAVVRWAVAATTASYRT